MTTHRLRWSGAIWSLKFTVHTKTNHVIKLIRFTFVIAKILYKNYCFWAFRIYLVKLYFKCLWKMAYMFMSLRFISGYIKIIGIFQILPKQKPKHVRLFSIKPIDLLHMNFQNELHVIINSSLLSILKLRIIFANLLVSGLQI